MTTRLSVDREGDVWLIVPETEDTDGTERLLGFVLDDHLCPAGLEDAWSALASEWMESSEDGRAERALWQMEYEESLGGLRW